MKVRVIALIALFIVSTGFAADPRPLPAPPVIGATSYLVIDATTGHEIASLEPDKAVAPASLTKMMTAWSPSNGSQNHNAAWEDE